MQAPGPGAGGGLSCGPGAPALPPAWGGPPLPSPSLPSPPRLPGRAEPSRAALPASRGHHEPRVSRGAGGLRAPGLGRTGAPVARGPRSSGGWRAPAPRSRQGLPGTDTAGALTPPELGGSGVLCGGGLRGQGYRGDTEAGRARAHRCAVETPEAPALVPRGPRSQRVWGSPRLRCNGVAEAGEPRYTVGTPELPGRPGATLARPEAADRGTRHAGAGGRVGNVLLSLPAGVPRGGCCLGSLSCWSPPLPRSRVTCVGC